MEFLECDLEEIIYKSDKDLLFERGLNVYGKLLRQKRIGNYGTADLIHFVRGHYPDQSLIEVIELKKGKIGISAFLQAVRYLKGIKRYLELRGFNTANFNSRITLIGKEIDSSGAFIYLPDVLPDGEGFVLEYYTYEYGVNGITFKQHNNYCLTDEGFKL